MIAEIRTFIDSTIKSVNSKYQGNTKPFEDLGNVVSTKMDYTYHVDIGAAAIEIGNELGNVANIEVILRLFRHGGSKKLDNYDEGYCEALLMNGLLVDNSRLNGTECIMGITTSSVNPVEVDGSQDLYSFESTLTFKISYGIGE